MILIQELYAAGLCSSKIAEILPCMRDTDGGPSEIATPRLAASLVADRMIADLVRSREVLDEVIEAASGAQTPGGDQAVIEPAVAV